MTELKTFSTKATAKAAVKRLGMQNMNYQILPVDHSIKPKMFVQFEVDNNEDYHEVIDRGFKAVITA